MFIIEPYALDKNLGREYNRQISRYEDEDWIVIKDYDILFLLPDTLRHIHEYTQRFPDAGLLTCYTNRLANKDQLLNGNVSENDSIKYHMNLALNQQAKLYQVTELTGVISGMVMVLKKSTWNDIKFSEEGLCLGVDNFYSKRLIEAGRKVLRMDGVYVFHIYRLLNGIKDKAHLV